MVKKKKKKDETERFKFKGDALFHKITKLKLKKPRATSVLDQRSSIFK